MADAYVALEGVFPQPLEREATRAVEHSIAQSSTADLGRQK